MKCEQIVELLLEAVAPMGNSFLQDIQKPPSEIAFQGRICCHEMNILPVVIWTTHKIPKISGHRSNGFNCP